MDSTFVSVTSERVEIVSAKSLAAGRYLLQNKGRQPVFKWERDAAVSDADTLDEREANILPPYLGDETIQEHAVEIETGKAIYLGVRSGESAVGIRDG